MYSVFDRTAAAETQSSLNLTCNDGERSGTQAKSCGVEWIMFTAHPHERYLYCTECGYLDVAGFCWPSLSLPAHLLLEV